LIKFFLSLMLLCPLSVMANETAAVEIQKMPEVMGTGNIVQIVLGLFVVLMMIFGAGWMMKRFGGFGGVSNANLKVVAGITVGQREKIVVVQAGDVQILVGIAPGNIRTLHVLDKNIDHESALTIKSATTVEPGSGFMDQLKQQVKNRATS